MNLDSIKVPHFGVGQINGVDSYLEGAIERLCQRNSITGTEKERLVCDLADTLEACKQLMGGVLSQAFVPALPQGRKLWRTLGDTFISGESQLKGKNNLDEAIDAMSKGSNVISIKSYKWSGYFTYGNTSDEGILIGCFGGCSIYVLTCGKFIFNTFFSVKLCE